MNVGRKGLSQSDQDGHPAARPESAATLAPSRAEATTRKVLRQALSATVVLPAVPGDGDRSGAAALAPPCLAALVQGDAGVQQGRRRVRVRNRRAHPLLNCSTLRYTKDERSK
jgi:hypothetical protein